jgi:hypothetical protein
LNHLEQLLTVDPEPLLEAVQVVRDYVYQLIDEFFPLGQHPVQLRWWLNLLIARFFSVF